MKFSFILVALLGFTQATTLKQMASAEPCEEALEVSEKELNIQLDYFSRKFDMKNYDNAMKIYGELKKQGKDPKVAVNTWELYDHSFSFVRVRRYDLVQQHMDLIQHMEDNLNQNFTNGQHLAQFIQVCKAAQKALNEKYHDGEFSDPANYDPQDEHPVTWSNVKLWTHWQAAKLVNASWNSYHLLDLLCIDEFRMNIEDYWIINI